MDSGSLYRRYLSSWRGHLILVAVFQILTAVFTIVSIPLLIPLFQILFEDQDAVALNDDVPEWMSTILSSILGTAGREKALLYFCAIIVLVFGLKNLFRYLARYFMVPVRHGFVRDLRSDLYYRYQSLDLSFFYRRQTGEIMSIFSNDVQLVESTILSVLESIVKAPLVILGCVGFMLMVNVKLTLFVMLLMLFVVLVIGGISKNLKQDSGQAQSVLGNLMGKVEENINAQKLIQSYSIQDFWIDRFEKENDVYYQLSKRVSRRQELGSPLSEFLGVTTVAVLMWFAAHLVFREELEPETFFAFVFAFYQVIEPSKSFANAFYSIRKGAGAMDRIRQVMGLEPNADKKHNQAKDGNLAFSSLSFDKVTFGYDKEIIIKNLSFQVKRGERVAISGPSGVGKTTIVDLMLRLYIQSSGRILLNDVSIEDFSSRHLRRHFAIVQQHTDLFFTTIEENIAMGSSIDLDRIKEVCQSAQLWSWISSLPQGTKTLIGTRGMRLSGGQRQRLSIARALYRDAPVIILDEATSSLDQDTEQAFINMCQSALVDKTIIIIAHQSQLLSLADRVITL